MTFFELLSLKTSSDVLSVFEKAQSVFFVLQFMLFALLKNLLFAVFTKLLLPVHKTKRVALTFVLFEELRRIC